MLQGIAFYLLAATAVVSGLLVVTARNPVHSVLWLILAFFSSAGLFVLLGAEFLAMLLVVVYVGAVAVLFLFVVMMLDIDFAKLREGLQRYAPLGAVIGAILFLELVLVYATWTFAPDASGLRLNPTPEGVDNTRALGRILYTDHVWLFQLSGLILLVAMIGAIVLTLRGTPTSKRQDVGKQVVRSGSVNLRQPPLGAGLGEIGIERPPVDAPAEAPRQVAHGGGHH
jgi:NADH-quinone oxidoreductase subunit J